MWAELLKAIGAALGVLSAAFLTYSTIRASKERSRQKALQAEFGLADNPERCGRHEEAIGGLKEDFADLKDENAKEHEQIFNQLQGISLELVGIKKDIEKR